MTKKYKKADEKVVWSIADCVVIARCMCGTDVIVDYDELTECDLCGKMYGISLSVNEYELNLED